MQMVTGPCSREDDMRAVADGWCADMMKHEGWLGGTYGFNDDGDFLGVVRFDSMQAYDACCATAEAGAHWAAALECFDSAPEIHQSEDVSIMLNDSSDGAGFVQVIRGRTPDPARLRMMFEDQEMTSMLHRARPDLLGSTMLIEPDGSFTETVCFTSEEEARAGESQDVPPEMASEMSSWQEAMTDLHYDDLHKPWFHSHG